MITFEDIKNTTGHIRYEDSGRGHLKMIDHYNPLSIMEAEFHFITETIIKYDLKRGFEVATAFGISALAAALGFKQTGGKLVTMDAYVEEKLNDAGAYKDYIDPVYIVGSHGYQSAENLREIFDVVSNLTLTIGWSPDDTGKTIESIFGDQKLDYALIDAGHFTDWIKKDVDAIKPYLDDKFVVFFHDVYPESFTDELINHIESSLGGKLEVVINYPYGENLGMVKVGI